MKNTIFRTLAFAAIALGVVFSNSVSAQNLLVNPDFEADDASGGPVEVQFPGEWQAFYSPESLVTQAIPAQSGVQSLLLYAPVQYAGAGAFQDFPANPGETYDASSWARIDSSDPFTGNNYGFSIVEFYDDATVPNKLSEAVSPLITSATNTNLGTDPAYVTQPLDTWVEYGLSATAPAGTTTVRFVMIFVQIEASAPGAIYFDNTSLTLNTNPGLAGDFDMDGDVDGNDFLVWQRDTNVGNLTDWQDNYGMPPISPTISAVPEPAAATLLMVSSVIGFCIRSRNRQSIA